MWLATATAQSGTLKIVGITSLDTTYIALGITRYRVVISAHSHRKHTFIDHIHFNQFARLRLYKTKMADVPLLLVAENSSSERRITPSWSISRLKAKLEPITGIPPSSQRLSLKTPAQGTIAIEANDEDSTYLTAFPLTAYAELHVSPYEPRGMYQWGSLKS